MSATNGSRLAYEGPLFALSVLSTDPTALQLHDLETVVAPDSESAAGASAGEEGLSRSSSIASVDSACGPEHKPTALSPPSGEEPAAEAGDSPPQPAFAAMSVSGGKTRGPPANSTNASNGGKRTTRRASPARRSMAVAASPEPTPHATASSDGPVAAAAGKRKRVGLREAPISKKRAFQDEDDDDDDDEDDDDGESDVDMTPGDRSQELVKLKRQLQARQEDLIGVSKAFKGVSPLERKKVCPATLFYLIITLSGFSDQYMT